MKNTATITNKTVAEKIASKSYQDYLKEQKNKEANEIAAKKVIQGYANHYGWSDVHPYEVIRTISHQTVEVREMDAKQIVFPKEFHIGGFSAHCADNHSQKYEYTSNEKYPIKRIRWSKAKNNWYYRGSKFLMEPEPYKHHDYNF